MYWTTNKTLNVLFPLYEYITLEFMTKNAIPENYFFVEKFVLTNLFISHQSVGICHKYYFLYLISLSPILQEHIQSYIVLENEH